MYTLLVAYADRRQFLRCLHCREYVVDKEFVSGFIGRYHFSAKVFCKNIVHGLIYFISNAKLGTAILIGFVEELKSLCCEVQLPLDNRKYEP